MSDRYDIVTWQGDIHNGIFSVNALIVEGWIPLGGILQTIENGMVSYHQAMWKPLPPPL